MTVALGLETSTEACSVALAVRDEMLEDHRVVARAHDRLVLEMVDGLLSRAGVARGALELVAFGHGPGSFTGLRIAAGVAQGLAWSLGAAAIGVSSLEALAATAARELDAEAVMVALDARMGEVYWNVFAPRAGRLAAVFADRLDPPETIVSVLPQTWAAGGTALGVGDAFALDAMPPAQTLGLASTVPGLLPHARELLVLALERFARGEAHAPREAVPVYLRDDGRWRRRDDG